MGEAVQFDVKPVPGTSYCWKVVGNEDLQGDNLIGKVTFLSGTNDPVICLKWGKAGKYLLTVTAINQDGCSNMKAFQVIIDNDHPPVAVDDLVHTTWLKDFTINLLNNDHDIGNDLDSLSLKILQKPELGKITFVGMGVIRYESIRNQAGKDRFYYCICDFNNQCDTAMVSVEVKDPPLYLPEAISPNGDGKNDMFIMKGLSSYPKSALTILSREGVIIYQSQDYQNDWAGEQNTRNFSSLPAPAGTYYYVLHLGGTNKVIKGFIYIAY